MLKLQFWKLFIQKLLFFQLIEYKHIFLIDELTLNKFLSNRDHLSRATKNKSNFEKNDICRNHCDILLSLDELIRFMKIEREYTPHCLHLFRT